MLSTFTVCSFNHLGKFHSLSVTALSDTECVGIIIVDLFFSEQNRQMVKIS